VFLLLPLSGIAQTRCLEHTYCSNSKKRFPMARTHVIDWLHLAEQTSKEKDPKRLLLLVKQLCTALDGERVGNPRLSESV